MTGKPHISSTRAFSLIDLLIGIVIGSILLIGAYKAFISNVETNTMALDLANLDSKTRNLVRMMQADIEDTNGNQLKGLPTVFPVFDYNNTIKGFVLFKAERHLPIFNVMTDSTPYDNSMWLTAPSNIDLGTDDLRSNFLHSAQDTGAVQDFLILYNFNNYTWVPYKINIESNFSSNTLVLGLEQWIRPSWSLVYWSEFLTTPRCTSFSTTPPSLLEDEAVLCTNNQYNPASTLALVVNVIRYEYDKDSGTIFRMENEDLSTKSIIADNVKDFAVTFPMRKSEIYKNHPYFENITVTKIADVPKFINNIVPETDSGVDTSYNSDCEKMIGYFCKPTAESGITVSPAYLGNYTQVAWGYFASQISGVNVNMELSTAQDRKQRRVNFLLTMDENHGSGAFDAFKPTRIVASRPDTATDRPYASQISNPAIYKDPNDGSLSPPWYHAAAPMVSIPWKNEDPKTYEHLVSMCDYCNAQGDCSAYPAICSQNKNTGGTDTSKLDYLECSTLGESLRTFIGCGSPQGSLNDTALLQADNRIDPKIVFLDNMASVQNTWDLSKNCGGTNCVLSDFYNSKTIGTYSPHSLFNGVNLGTESWHDQLFPLTVLPDFSEEDKKIYVGVARTRWPSEGGPHNYLDKYYSTIFEFSGVDPDTKLPTSYKVISDARADAGIISHASEPAIDSKFDLDGVSQIAIREENGLKYMYLSSHTSHSLGYRVKDNSTTFGWSQIYPAFHNDAVFNKRFTWMFQEAFPCSDMSDPGSCGGIQRFTAIPTNDYSYTGGQHWYSNKRIAHILAPEGIENDRIYFTEVIDEPDELVDGRNGQWFYERPITYNKPIMLEDGTRLSCDPNSASGLEADCYQPSNKAKPIDWSICLGAPDPLGSYGVGLGPNGNNCMLSNNDWTKWSSEFPIATDVRPNYSSAFKVAFKKADNDWVIKTIGYIHDTSTSLLEDPITGDIIIGGPSNIKVINKDAINDILDDNVDESPKLIDLNWKRPGVDVTYSNPSTDPPVSSRSYSGVRSYTANNMVSAYLDPAVEGFDELEFRKLSGISLEPDTKNLNIVFSDMINRELGYIVQERDLDKQRVVATIVQTQSADGGHDANLDDIAVYPSDKVSRGEEFSKWLLPYHSTKSWADAHRKATDIEGAEVAVFPIAGPIPLPPQQDIYKMDDTENSENLRQLSRNDQNCFADPNDPNITQGSETVCGQDPLYRECAGDVLSRMSIGLLGRQTSRYGCGLESPYASEDPFEPIAPPASSGSTSGTDPDKDGDNSSVSLE